jgi:hypothetical protein
MTSDIPETQPASETPKSAPRFKLSRILVAAIALTLTSLLSSFATILANKLDAYYFVLVFDLLASVTGLLSVPLYLLAIALSKNQRVLAFALGTVSFFLLFAMWLQIMVLPRIAGMRFICQTNLRSLQAALIKYSNDHGQLLPSENWCDVLTAKYNIQSKDLVCKNSDAHRGQSSYALNENLIGRKLTDANPDTVMLLETNPGWNQTGDANEFAFDHHNGSNIVFADGRIRYVSKDKIPTLRWNP